MKSARMIVVAGVVAALTATGARAQEAQRPRQRGMEWGRMAQNAMVDAIATVVTNDAVAKAIGLTAEQRNVLREKLDAEQVAAILAAVRLSEAVTAILADAALVTQLGLTEEQVKALRQNLTPELLRKVMKPLELERLARGLTTGATAGAMARFMQERAPGMGAAQGALTERMKEFDKDGDGQLSAEERQAAMDAWRQRRVRPRDGGAQGRPRPRDGGAQERPRPRDGAQRGPFGG